jgi:hypothetical protein
VIVFIPQLFSGKSLFGFVINKCCDTFSEGYKKALQETLNKGFYQKYGSYLYETNGKGIAWIEPRLGVVSTTPFYC